MRRKFNSILSLLLVTVLMLSLLAGCEKKPEKDSPNAVDSGSVKLWYAYNTENLMQDLEYPELMAARDSTLRMHGVRDDVESIQLMITPSVNVASYDFKINDLKNDKGDVFKAENFEFFAEWYIEITESYNMDAYYGFYPDALVPLENYQNLHHDSIDAGQNQGIWVNANIPVDQAPGFYTGTGELDIDGTKFSVPVELTVYDVVLPEENHMPSSFAIWYDHIVYGEGYYSTELAEAYFDFLVEKRTMPLDADPSKRTDYDTFVNWVVETQFDDPKIASYGLPYKIAYDETGRRIVDRSSVKSLLTKMAEKSIELREAGNEDADLFKKAFYYMGSITDEPTGDALHSVRICDLIVSECKIEIADKYFKDKYQDLYESLMGLRVVVTTGYNTELLGSDTTGGVHTWCPQYQHWNSESQREEYYARRDTTDRLMGEGIWWYGCNNPKVPFPTFHLDDNLISSRVLYWMQHDYHVQGDLYWCVNIFKVSDPWNIPVVTESVQEGRLVYPGAKYGIFGPISTLRMESIREGREDYECFYMIEQAIYAYNEANGTDYEIDDLMDYLYADLYEGVVPERDGVDECEIAELFVERRIAMLKVLEQITADPAAGIETLLNG